MPRRLRSLADLHDDYAGALHAFAQRRLGDREAAEEVVQDTLVRAWRDGARFDPDLGSEAAWLFTICANLVTDRLRRRGARPVTIPPPGDDGWGQGRDGKFDDRQIDRLLEAWQLAEAVAGLSAQHREAVVLCHYRGHSVAEAATILGVPEGTIKSRVFYGLRALRLRLEEQGVIG